MGTFHSIDELIKTLDRGKGFAEGDVCQATFPSVSL